MTDSRLSKLALGCYPLGGGYGNLDLETARATVDAALDAGWTFFDTAEGYLDSEIRLGRFLAGRRDQVFLATKVFPNEPYTYKNMRVSLNNSLRKLRTDRIDLLQLHGPPDWVITFDDAPSMAEVGESLARLVESGDVLNVGVCNLPVPLMEELSSTVRLYSTQNLWSLYDQVGTDDGIHLPVGESIIPWCRENSVHVFAFSPLARGLLADGLSPDRTFPTHDERFYLARVSIPTSTRNGRVCPIDWKDGPAINGRTLVQLAVAWTLATPGVTSTLIGAKTPRHIEAMAGADEWELSEADLQEIDDVIATLPPNAAAALSIVWDHFPEEAVRAMADRRHGR